MAETQLAAYEFRRGGLRGSHLGLSSTRLAHRGPGFIEAMPLSRIAAVRVAYEREPARMGQGAGLAILALILLVASHPAQDLLAVALAELTGQAPGGNRFLIAALRLLALVAAALPVLAAGLGLCAIAWGVRGWMGYTSLTVSAGATERTYSTPRHDPALFEFGETLSDRLANGD